MSTSGLEQESEAGIWFELFDVEPATELLRTYSTRDSVGTLIKGDVESCAGFAETDCCVDIVTNPLVTVVVLAFSQHRPLFDSRRDLDRHPARTVHAFGRELGNVAVECYFINVGTENR